MKMMELSEISTGDLIHELITRCDGGVIALGIRGPDHEVVTAFDAENVTKTTGIHIGVGQQIAMVLRDQFMERDDED